MMLLLRELKGLRFRDIGCFHQQAAHRRLYHGALRNFLSRVYPASTVGGS